ncbi:YhgE/Pip domain-containing protein [Aeromicrobium sp. NPDC092404]|uniref:YhgE/Pip domain-containing protein n=1 Tax=Aeromicrobium sp. NPDC092404 TaxID=3154976 RepID=UPI00344746F1
MIPSPTLPWFELARFRRSRLTRAAIVAVMMVPLFYGALYVWANINPTGHLDHVRAAVVNEDKVVEITGRDGKKQPVAVGRQLAGNLVSNDDKDNYDWVLTDAKDAEAGLSDGSYKAVLTIPSNLSKAATSTSGDPAEAVQGNLDLRTNDAVNYINGTIAQTILKAAKTSLNAQVTETYLDNIYLSFSDIKMALSEAADGAGKLSDGADQLAAGASDLADGNRQLADGAGRLDSGAQQLAGGLSQLDSRTSALPGQTRQLADGAQQVAAGVAQINQLVQGVTSGINGSTGAAKAQINQLVASLRSAAESCRQADPDPPQCAELDAAADRTAGLAGVVDDLADQADGYAGQTKKLSDGAAQVAAGNAELAANVPQLVDAIGKASDGAQQLASGTSQLSSGAAEAAKGADQLSGGADQLSAGALKLVSGLDDGSEQVPDYDKSEREQLARTAATPITEAPDRVNPVKNYGEALAPYFIALALWVGAMAIYLLLRPLSARAIASTTGSIRTALAGYVPGLVLSFVQVVLLLAVLLGVLRIDAASPLLLLGVALATGAVFTAINQMFVALFGGAGRFVALVFVCLQLTAAGGTYPIETAPRFFNLLHDVMPMTYAVHGFRAATAGGGTGVTRDFVVLALFTVLALSVTVIAARRRQTVTMARLHPTLLV